MKHRIDKINELVAQELSKMIEISCSSILGMVNVNFVLVSPDLQNASVYVSLVGKKITNKDIQFLQRKAYNFQNQLAKKLAIRYIPKLQFLTDDKIEQVNQIDAIFEHIDKEKKIEH